MIAAAVFRLHPERMHVQILLTEMVAFKVIGRRFGAASRSFHLSPVVSVRGGRDDE